MYTQRGKKGPLLDMRCPECNTRNSVAANTCIQCGFKFKRKSCPRWIKIPVSAAVVCGALWFTATYILPSIVDPEKNLKNIAIRVAAGPKSPGESVWMLRQFNGCLERYLEKFGVLSAPQLNAEMRKLLPTSAFEVYVVNLPQHLKLVEVDTLLQGNSFLLMSGAAVNTKSTTSSGATTKVIPINGLEVYEDNRAINDPAGPILVLLGHSGGQPPHTPQIKVYAVLPKDLSDESDKSVPPVIGEGTARFVGMSHDISADLSLLSIAKTKHIFSEVTPLDDTTTRQYLTWMDNKYVSQRVPGPGPFAALYVVAACLQKPPEIVSLNKSVLGDQGMRFVKQYHSDQPGNFKVQRVKTTPNKVQYVITNDRSDKYAIVVARASTRASKGIWHVVQAGTVTPEAEANAVGQPGQKIFEQLVSNNNHRTLPEKVMQAAKIVQETHMNPIRISKSTRQPSSLTAPAGTIVLNRQINIDGATLRSGPSVKSVAITHLSKGEQIQVIGKQDGWCKIRIGGKEGYVYGGLIGYSRAQGPAVKTSLTTRPVKRTPALRPDMSTRTNPTANNMPASGPHTSATIVQPYNLHDINHKPISPLKVGEHVTVIGGLEGRRYEIKLPNGKTGYVDKNALDISATSSTANAGAGTQPPRAKTVASAPVKTTTTKKAAAVRAKAKPKPTDETQSPPQFVP